MRPLWAFIPGWLLVAVTVVGNSLVIFLITTRRKLRSTTNWLILSLALADFGVGAAWYPTCSFCSTRYKTCMNQAARIAHYVGALGIHASVMNLCVLTLDRYLAIVHPLRYVTFMTKKRVALLISAAWGVATLASISGGLFYTVFSEQSQQIIHLICTIVLQAFVCILLLFTVARILNIVHRGAKRNSAILAQLNFNHKLHKGVSFRPRETSSAKMIGIVVVVFFVTYTLWTADIVLLFAGSPFSRNMVEILLILTLLNSAVNPVVYAFHKRDIKTELKRMFHCNEQQQQQQQQQQHRMSTP